MLTFVSDVKPGGKQECHKNVVLMERVPGSSGNCRVYKPSLALAVSLNGDPAKIPRRMNIAEFLKLTGVWMLDK